jgi:hypothetical protein
VSDAALLAEHDNGVVINCAVNLDIDWVNVPEPEPPHICSPTAAGRFVTTSWG